MTAKKFIVRPWLESDIPNIVKCQHAAYKNFTQNSLCTERDYQLQFSKFPEGQFLVENDKGKVIGFTTSIIILLPEDTNWLSYAEVTGVGTFSTHNPSGDTLYGADIAVHPDYHQQGISKLLYKQRIKLLKKYNLRRMVATGRIPGYSKFAGKLTADEYVNKVVDGSLKDQALNAHLSAGYKVKGVYLNYLADEASLNYSTFLELENKSYNKQKRQIANTPLQRVDRKIRVCSVQYQMRKITSFEEFSRQVEFFIETANEYNCHFLLFPELFTAQLFSLMPRDMSTHDAIGKLSEYHQQYIELFTQFAKESSLYIIAGSHPIKRGEKIYNTAHLFSPTGNVYTQDKIHVTPGERRQWAITPGEELKVFETSFGRIAIPICYDIEFPEYCRALALSGAEILFVPFATDEHSAYRRVRNCAQARAVENIVYVVLSGNVGNLQQVRSFLINYGQSAILTPCDVSFPKGGIAAEAEPNVETVVMTDLDLTTLDSQRIIGSVHPLMDRREDLYSLKLTTPVRHEIVK